MATAKQKNGEHFMIDLAARVHYKAHFDIVPNQDGVDLLFELIEVIRLWLNRKYGKRIQFWNWSQFQKFGQFSTDDRSVYAKSTSFIPDATTRYWACKIEEFQKPQTQEDTNGCIIEKAPRTWTTEVGYEQMSENRATISFIVYYMDKAGFVGQLGDSPQATTPSIVYRLLSRQKFSCLMGGSVISDKATLIPAGTADRFASLLIDAARDTPVILLIPTYDYGDERAFQVLPDELMKSVAGNALLYYAEKPSFSEELSYFLGRQYWCMPGQIRLYMPDFDVQNPSDGLRHRYLHADQIRQMGGDKVIEMFRRVLSQDIRYYESKEMFRCEDCDDLYRRNRLAELRKKYNTAKETATMAQISKEEFESLLEMSEEENKELRQKMDGLESVLSDSKGEIWRLTSLNDHLSHFQTEMRGKEESLRNARNISSMPCSPREVADYFRKVFRDTIDFTDRGLRSLDTTFK